MTWRETVWSHLSGPWDVLIIGGGITGAGILLEAAQAGLRALLVEGHDFAYGTSSRSSKLVHGGLRYLKQARLGLTLQSVHERERLLREAPGLVQPLDFVLAHFAHERPPSWVYGAGLLLYDFLALKWQHQPCTPETLLKLCPNLRSHELTGGYLYQDAATDDARLVLHVLAEARRAGGVALNYCRAIGLLRDRTGQVRGAVVRAEADAGTVAGRELEVHAGVVVNATGAWADELRGTLPKPARLRPLRGSHLIFPREALPLAQAVSLLHPSDHRPVFFMPWEGVALVGTTDADHREPLALEPRIGPEEFDYLVRAVEYAFPALEPARGRVRATYAGVRPVIDTGQADPSAESREHVLWDEAGLVTVAGGKLTTFRLMARAALRAIRRQRPARPPASVPALPPEAVGGSPCQRDDLDPGTWLRLVGRYGHAATEIVAEAVPSELERIDGTPYIWAELRWVARAEAAVHLDDLLLRRLRLGLLLPNGGLAHRDRIRTIVMDELGWSPGRWGCEVGAYARQWEACYAVPGTVSAEVEQGRLDSQRVV